MAAQLIPINAGSTPSIAVNRPVLLIGRHPECDVRIDDIQVSRRHCCLAMANERLLIRDLGSRNGVRVNGQLVEEVQLRSGDEVAIAQYLYRLDLPQVAAVRPAKPTLARPAPALESPPRGIDLDDDFVAIDL